MQMIRRSIPVLLSAAAIVLAGCSSASHQPGAVSSDGSANLTTAALPQVSKGTPAATPQPNKATPVASQPARKSTPALSAAPTGGPHFATPQAAMRYLAAAYNRNDLVALKHVTTPAGRANLLSMRKIAVNLQLVGCTPRAGLGDYTCKFTHDYPASMHTTRKGHAEFIAGPARNVGWYMTVLESCG